ncbi:MAG: metallophosphoesterase family protein [Anaerolineales bacterium]
MFGKKFSGSKTVRILYGSDFHGSELVFRKFLAAAMQYKANVLIVGGDVTGKAMIPVVNQGNGVYVGYLFGRKEEATTPEELERVKRDISNVGFYPIVLEKDEADELENDRQKLDARFEKEMQKRVREWMELAEEKLAPQNIHLYFMPGNDDLASIDAEIEGFEHVHNPDMRRYVIEGDYELYGNSNANMTPWACARDLEEADLAEKLNQLEKLIQNPEKAVCVLHVPPYNTTLDQCPELDKDLRIVTQGGQVVMKSAGSTAVRDFIERVQPLLTLHGHIHESPGHTRIGRTLCINAGSEYAEGIMKAAIINLENGTVKGHLLISG